MVAVVLFVKMADIDANELEAIQEAIRASASSPPLASESGEAVYPLPLIADDRAAESAKPVATRIAERWAQLIQKRMRRVAALELNVSGVEIVDGAAVVRDEGAAWRAAANVSGHAGGVLAAVSGRMIGTLVARLLGEASDFEEDEPEEQPEPSLASLRLFEPLGVAFMAALADAWSEEQHCDVSIASNESSVDELRTALSRAEVVVQIMIKVSGAVEGTLALWAKPSAFVQPARALDAVPASAGAIEDALGGVPVELVVELGTASMSMASFEALEVGSVIRLSTFVDDPLSIECGGVNTGFGRAAVYRGALAVEICDPAELSEVKK